MMSVGGIKQPSSLSHCKGIELLKKMAQVLYITLRADRGLSSWAPIGQVVKARLDEYSVVLLRHWQN